MFSLFRTTSLANLIHEVVEKRLQLDPESCKRHTPNVLRHVNLNKERTDVRKLISHNIQSLQDLNRNQRNRNIPASKIRALRDESSWEKRQRFGVPKAYTLIETAIKKQRVGRRLHSPKDAIQLGNKLNWHLIQGKTSGAGQKPYQPNSIDSKLIFKVYCSSDFEGDDSNNGK